MGQGYFTIYGYGASFKKNEEILKIVYDEDMDLRPFLDEFNTCFNSDLDKFYIAIPLADCGQGYLMGDEAVVSMTSYSLTEAKDNLLQTLKKENQDSVLIDAELKWKSLQEEFKKLGYDLPDGEIIIIHDYD